MKSFFVNINMESATKIAIGENSEGHGHVMYFLEDFMATEFGYSLKFCFHDFKNQILFNKYLSD